MKKQEGITLIALVITIIVLLILAAVSIATLTGENGILTRANEAKEETVITTAEEKVEVEVLGSYDNSGNISIENLNKNLENVTGLTSGLPIEFLPATVEVDGYEIIIGDNGNVSTVIRISEYQTEDTKPYLPSSNFKVVENTSLENGLVITDGTNNWVWIEVPKSIYSTAKSEIDYVEIEKDMETYTKTLVSRNGCEDVWYDGEGNTAENASNLNDTTGCGLTYEEYNSLKKYMLKSIYKNGGFWIGQYEVGSDIYPATPKNDKRTALIQKDLYPYNYISCSNAQIKSNELNSGNYISSLMFGIQWDLILKHIEVKGKVPREEIVTNSINWGNYSRSEFFIDNGKYSTKPYHANSFIDYSEDTNGYVEDKYKFDRVQILLTTGARILNSKMNIYDLAGNLFEWTLEKSNVQYSPSTIRGGYFNNLGNDYPVSSRYFNSTSTEDIFNGFRPALY